MRCSRGVIGWLPLVLLTACVASYPGEHQAGTIRPAVDRLLNRGDIQVAQTHLREFGFDPGADQWDLYCSDASRGARLPGQLWALSVGAARL
jgi:hypothetical protein